MRPAHCAIQYNSRIQQLACHLILCGAHPNGALFQCFHHRLHFFVPSRPPCCLWSPFLRNAPCYAHCFGAAEWVAAVAAFRQTHFVFFFSICPLYSLYRPTLFPPPFFMLVSEWSRPVPLVSVNYLLHIYTGVRVSVCFWVTCTVSTLGTTSQSPPRTSRRRWPKRSIWVERYTQHSHRI